MQYLDENKDLFENFQPVDFSQIIHDIQSHAGYTQEQIAEIVGCSQFVISTLLTGKRREPRFHLGSRLLALHARRGRP